MDTSSLDKEVNLVVKKAVVTVVKVRIDLRLTKLNQYISGLIAGGESSDSFDMKIKQRLDEIRKEIRSESDDAKCNSRFKKQSD